MIRYILLARSELTATALEAWVELVDPLYSQEEGQKVHASIVWPSSDLGVEAFRRIADRMEEIARNQFELIPQCQITVLVDQADLNALNPISDTGWDGVVAMLILAFPEFRWVFGVTRNTEELGRQHKLIGFLGRQVDPIFDGTGIRDLVRQKAIFQRDGVETNAFLPQRKQLAIALDDEPDYAYFHAYAAYRFGFRSIPVHSGALAADLLTTEGDQKLELNVGLFLEDIYLNFPDQSSLQIAKDVHLSNLKDRDTIFPLLNKFPDAPRVFITSNHRVGGGADRRMANKEVFFGLRLTGRLGTVVTKPTPGFFSLWEDAGLMRRFRARKDLLTGEKTRARDGQAEGFYWPPKSPKSESGLYDSGKTSHSSPGRLLEVANRLMARAEILLADGKTVQDALQGAVLATDALELLGGRTPTASFEALSLKHQLETKAACLFHGTKFNLHLKPHLKEIRDDIRYIGQWFDPQTREEAEMNAELGIMSELAAIYREYAEFDEERICLNRVRDLCRMLDARHQIFTRMTYFLRFYMDFLMGSLNRLIVAIAVWSLALTLLFAYLPDGRAQSVACACACGSALAAADAKGGNSQKPENLIADGVEATLTSFFQTQPAKWEGDPKRLGLSAIAILFGFVHLGIFISHLYTINSRR